MAQQVMKQMNNGQGPNQQQQQQIQQMMQQMQAQANAQQRRPADATGRPADGQGDAAGRSRRSRVSKASNKARVSSSSSNSSSSRPSSRWVRPSSRCSNRCSRCKASCRTCSRCRPLSKRLNRPRQQAMNAMNGQAGNQGQGQNGGQWQGNGQIQGNGQQNQPWNGQQGPAGPNQGGIGAGDRNYKEQAPYAVKPEVSPSTDNEKGRIIASTLVKAGAIKGESKAELKQIARETRSKTRPTRSTRTASAAKASTSCATTPRHAESRRIRSRRSDDGAFEISSEPQINTDEHKSGAEICLSVFICVRLWVHFSVRLPGEAAGGRAVHQHRRAGRQADQCASLRRRLAFTSCS